jgi:hypothetical protein
MNPIMIVAIVGVGISVSVTGFILYDQNNQIQTIQNELNFDNEITRCLSTYPNDQENFLKCSENVIEKYDVVLDPFTQSMLDDVKESSQTNSYLDSSSKINLSNCNYTPTQRIMLDSIENNDSIDVGVKNQQIIQIMQQACN